MHKSLNKKLRLIPWQHVNNKYRYQSMHFATISSKKTAFKVNALELMHHPLLETIAS
jgi:hypothetical protein